MCQTGEEVLSSSNYRICQRLWVRCVLELETQNIQCDFETKEGGEKNGITNVFG